MTKNPHVFTSISTIAFMILPILFALGLFLSEIIYPILTIHSADWSLFFTISGIVTLVLLLIPPPPNKKKRGIFLYTIKSLWKKFFKPKLTETIKFDNNVVHFATVKESTEDTPLDDEMVKDDSAITESKSLDDSQQEPNHESIFAITIRKNTKIRLLCSKLNTPLQQIHSIFWNKSLFKNRFFALVFTLFLSGTNSLKMNWKSNGFGGATFESRIKPQNQLQLEVKNEFKR
ncbi:MAG: hypothetical protein LUQ65_01525 [Candidatus Helarchaeota archaeon]|nr:hypothetical protein [Candidatus Helarchaeota archaeon]